MFVSLVLPVHHSYLPLHIQTNTKQLLGILSNITMSSSTSASSGRTATSSPATTQTPPSSQQTPERLSPMSAWPQHRQSRTPTRTPARPPMSQQGKTIPSNRAGTHNTQTSQTSERSPRAWEIPTPKHRSPSNARTPSERLLARILAPPRPGGGRMRSPHFRGLYNSLILPRRSTGQTVAWKDIPVFDENDEFEDEEEDDEDEDDEELDVTDHRTGRLWYWPNGNPV